MSTNSKTKLLVISGSSGVGKGTVIKSLLEKCSNINLSVSCTTRSPRPGEEHGVNYFFLSKEEFKESIANDDFLEWAEFSENLCQLYENLSGSARIEEPYGVHMYLLFQGDGKGHIDVRGELYQTDSLGIEQELRFASRFDQTYLKCFCYDLKRSYERYLK